jgi:hypothetical protein
VGQVVPEPDDQAAHHLTLLARVWLRATHRHAREQALSIEQKVVGSTGNVLVVARVPDRELTFGAVGEDEEECLGPVKVFEEQRLAEQPDEVRPGSEELLIRVLGRDQTKIDVRVRVGRARGMRATDEGGQDARVGPAGRPEPVDDRVAQQVRGGVCSCG